MVDGDGGLFRSFFNGTLPDILLFLKMIWAKSAVLTVVLVLSYDVPQNWNTLLLKQAQAPSET